MAKEQRSRPAVSMKGWSENVEVFGSKSVKIPSEVGRVKVKTEGNRWFNFVPYKAGPNNPNCDEGKYTPELMYWVHRNIGPADDMVVCSAKSFGRPCYVCEERDRLKAGGKASEDLIKSMYPSPRQLWNVEDAEDEPGKLQVWDHSFHLFGKQLKHKLDSARDESDKYDYFADPDRGYTVKIYFTKRPGGYGFEATNIEFRKRGEPLSDALLEQAVFLEGCLIETPYAKIKKMYLQEPDAKDDARPSRDGKGAAAKGRPAPPADEDEEEEAAPAPKKGKAKPVAYKVGQYVTYKDAECEVIKVSGDGTSLTLEDEDGEIHKGVGPEEVAAVPVKGKAEPVAKEEDEEEAPAPKKGKAKPVAEDDDEDEEDDDEDDEEEEESFEEEEEDEEEEAPPKKRAKK